MKLRSWRNTEATFQPDVSDKTGVAVGRFVINTRQAGQCKSLQDIAKIKQPVQFKRY